MKKLYIFLFYLLFISTTFASSCDKWRKAKAYYEGCEDKITDELMVKSVLLYKKDKNDENSFHVCVASYICSDNEIKGMIENELSKSDKVVLTTKEILKRTANKH